MRHLPNLICLARIALIAPLLAAMLAGDQVRILLLFSIAAVSDALDGYLDPLLEDDALLDHASGHPQPVPGLQDFLDGRPFPEHGLGRREPGDPPAEVFEVAGVGEGAAPEVEPGGAGAHGAAEGEGVGDVIDVDVVGSDGGGVDGAGEWCGLIQFVFCRMWAVSQQACRRKRSILGNDVIGQLCAEMVIVTLDQ